MVPAEILSRNDKIGFAVPDDPAEPGRLNRLMQDVFQSESFRRRPYWDWKKVEAEFKSISRNTSGSRPLDEIWRLFILELWLRRWIDPG